MASPSRRDPDRADLFDASRRGRALRYVPSVVIGLGFVLGPPVAAWFFTLGFAAIGTACVLNARRCGRRHCFFTGPLYLVVAAVSVAYGIGVLRLDHVMVLGAPGWVLLGLVGVLGGVALTTVTERESRYRAR